MTLIFRLIFFNDSLKISINFCRPFKERAMRTLYSAQLHPPSLRGLHAYSFNPFVPTVAFNICCWNQLKNQTQSLGQQMLNATVGTNGLILFMAWHYMACEEFSSLFLMNKYHLIRQYDPLLLAFNKIICMSFGRRKIFRAFTNAKKVKIKSVVEIEVIYRQ